MTDVSRYDVVLSVSTGAAGLIIRGGGPRYVLQAHGTALEEPTTVLRLRGRRWMLRAARMSYWSLVDRLLYRRADAVVSIGPAVSAALGHGFYGLRRAHVQILELVNGIDRGAGFERTRPDSEAIPRVTYIGRLSSQKGVETIIRALDESEAFLQIVGAGDERDGLEKLAEELRVSDRVEFVGNVSRERVHEILLSCDALLFTPEDFTREGLPMAVLEALAFSVPVITYASTVWPDDVARELTFVPPGNRAALARAIDACKQLPSTELPNRFSLEHASSAYLELFEHLRAKG